MSSYTPLPEPTLESLLSPLSRSLSDNKLGAEGGKAISHVLRDTQITSLKYAALPFMMQPRPSVSARVLTHALTHVRQPSHYVRPPWHSVDGHALQIDELQGTKPTEKIDLSGKRLNVASAIIIASCIKENNVLKELKCAAHPQPCSLR